ncbi:MAG: TlpA disulfide reductase family protein [bacterium]
MKKITILLLILTVSIVVFAGLRMKNSTAVNQQTNQETEDQDNKAPNFTITTIEGETITLSDYKDKVVIIDFWDTWCPPCRRGIPDFIELYKEYKDSGFVMIGLAFGREGEEKVKEFANEYEINYPVAIANRSLINSFGEIRSIPTAFLIDQEGNIVNKYIGLRPKEIFENDIKELLDIKTKEK